VPAQLPRAAMPAITATINSRTVTVTVKAAGALDTNRSYRRVRGGTRTSIRAGQVRPWGFALGIRAARSSIVGYGSDVAPFRAALNDRIQVDPGSMTGSAAIPCVPREFSRAREGFFVS
jgi:hypothetical protein